MQCFLYDYYRTRFNASQKEPRRRRIQMLIEHVDKEQKYDQLLDQIARLRSRQYRQFADKLQQD